MKFTLNTLFCIGLIVAAGINNSCTTSKKSSTNNLVAVMEVKEPIDGV